MDKQLREQLKHDKFVEEVTHTVEYLSEHQAAVRKWGTLAAAVILIVGGAWVFLNWQRSSRQEELRKAQAVLDAPVGEGLTYKAASDRDAAALKAFSDAANKLGNSREGAIARLQEGILLCDQGKEAECEKALKSASENGDAEGASLAKLSLATFYQSQGRIDQAEALLRQLMDRPTAMVSKEQATIALARVIGKSKNAEAKKLLEGLQGSSRAPVSRSAVAAMGELAAAK